MQKKWPLLLGAMVLLGVLAWALLGPKPTSGPGTGEETAAGEVKSTSGGQRPALIPKVLPTEEGATPPPPPPPNIAAATPPGERDPLGEVDLSEATDGDRERLKVPRKWGKGVILRNVGPDSPMALSALRDEDVIVRAHRTEVNSVSDLKTAFTGRDHTVVIVARDGRFFEAVIHRPEEH